MVFNLYIFLGLQLILAICFFLFKPSKHQTTTYLKLPSKLHFFIMSLAVFLICIHINLEFQLFCIPVVWVKILLAIFCVSYLTFPFASQKVIQRLLAIPVSIGFFISIYTIVFGELWYPIWIVINIPLLFIIRLSVRSLNKRFDTKFFDCFMFYQHTVLAPFYLLYYTIQMTSPVYIKILSVSALFTFILFTILSLRISFLVKNIEHLETNKKPITSLLQNPVDSYLIDLILGAHWKYHTEFCPYDGWRPPYHDPVLVFANKMISPLSDFNNGVSYKRSMELYRLTFPNKETKFSCKCAKNERLFFNNVLWSINLKGP